jgi:hypothetical protein
MFTGADVARILEYIFGLLFFIGMLDCVLKIRDSRLLMFSSLAVLVFLAVVTYTMPEKLAEDFTFAR